MVSTPRRCALDEAGVVDGVTVPDVTTFGGGTLASPELNEENRKLRLATSSITAYRNSPATVDRRRLMVAGA